MEAEGGRLKAVEEEVVDPLQEAAAMKAVAESLGAKGLANAIDRFSQLVAQQLGLTKEGE